LRSSSVKRDSPLKLGVIYHNDEIMRLRNVAALPPDVAKGLSLPLASQFFRGCASDQFEVQPLSH
jgi:hypothetical protein